MLYLPKNQYNSKLHDAVRSRLLGGSLEHYFLGHPLLVGSANQIKSESGLRLLSTDDKVKHELNKKAVIDIEASIDAINENLTPFDLWGLKEVVDEVYRTEAEPYCLTHDQKLTKIDLEEISKQVISEYKKDYYVGVGHSYFVSGKHLNLIEGGVSDVLLWKLREARAQGLRRFVIDNQYIELESQDKPDQGKVTKLESTLLLNKTKLMMAESIISFEAESLYEKLKAAKFELEHAEATDIELVLFKRSGEIIKRYNLNGTHYCEKCENTFNLSRYDLSSVEKIGVSYYFNNKPYAEILNSDFNEILSTLKKSKQDISEYHDLKNSKVENKLHSNFSSLSYFERVIVFLWGLFFRGGSDKYFILNSVQRVENSWHFEEVIEVINKCIKNGLSFICFIKPDSVKNIEYKYVDDLLEEAINAEDLIEEPLTIADCANYEVTNDLANFKKFISSSKSRVINVYGDVGSGKTNLLKSLVEDPSAISTAKTSAKQKTKKVDVTYFSFENNSVQILSTDKVKLLREKFDAMSSVYDVFGLRKIISEFYSQSTSARKNNLFVEDFVNPRESSHRCLHCLGEGVLSYELELSYQNIKRCSYCLGSGCGEVFDQVKFFDFSFRELFKLDFKSILDMFEGEKGIFEVKKAFNSILIAKCGLEHRLFSVKVFELTYLERQILVIMFLILSKKANSIFILEHFFENLLQNSANLTNYFNLVFEEINAYLIVSNYAKLSK